MILDSDKKLLKRYRHLIAALIAYSIGYSTPLAALRTIQDYKNNQPNIIKGSIKYRHCSDFAFALAVVDKNIAGFEYLGAGWF